jgi:hypothetical protein
LYEGGPTRRRLFSFGFALSPWQTADYEFYRSIGRFEGESFDPLTWKPRIPTAAYFEMRADDGFWAARKVMAFSDELIRAVVKAGEYTDERAEAYLADVLIKRRDAIGRAYLTRVNPIVDPALDGTGTLTFGNAALQYKFADAPRGYAATWYAFDNTTGESRRIGETTGAQPQLRAPEGLPAGSGSYLRVEITADHPGHPSWVQPVQAYFVRQAAGWKLVGFERLP